MPLGPGNEHLSERLHRKWEAEIERRQQRLEEAPREYAELLVRIVEAEARLADPDLPREERKPLRADVQELREDAADLKREQARLREDIEKAKREWRAAVAAEGAEAIGRLVAEMDAIVDQAGNIPMETWAREHLDAARLVSALVQRWLNSMGASTTTIVGGFEINVRAPMWSRPSEARAEDLIAWTVKSVRYRQRLAKQQEAVK